MSEAVLGSTTLVRLLNTVYRVEVSNGGGTDTFRITVNGETTATILEDANSATVQAAIEALASISSGDVTVSQGLPVQAGEWFIEFEGEYLGQKVNLSVGSETGTLESLTSIQFLELDIEGQEQDATNYADIKGVWVDTAQEYAYVLSGSGDSISSIDLLNPTPASLARLDTLSDAININDPREMVLNLAGSLAFIANYTGDGIAVIDTSTPGTLAKLGQIVGDTTDLNGAASIDIGASEDYVYVGASLNDKLTVVTVSTPASPVVSDSVALGDTPSGVAVTSDEDYCYVTLGGTNEVVVVDVSNPAAISVVASPEITAGTIGKCVLSKDELTLFIVDPGNEELHAVDVSNPLNPTLISTFSFTGQVIMDYISLSSNGNQVYVATADTVFVVDVQTPALMKIISGYANSSQFQTVPKIGVMDEWLIVPSVTVTKVNAVSIAQAGTETTVGSQVDATLVLSNGRDEITNKQSPALPGGALAKEHIITDQEETLDMNNIFTPFPHDTAQTSLKNAARDSVEVQLVIYDTDSGERETWRSALIQNLGNTNAHNAARRQAYSFTRSGASVYTG